MLRKKIGLLVIASLISSYGLAVDFYVGGGGGMLQAGENRTVNYLDSTQKINLSSNPYHMGSTGFLGETYLGLGQKMQSFYLGAELGGYYSGAKTKQEAVFNNITTSSTLTNRFGGSASALIGAYIAPNNMIYTRIGGIYSDFGGSSTTDAWRTGYTGSFNKWDMGGLLGLGLDSRFTQAFSIRAEFDYAQYKKFNMSNPANAAQPLLKQTTFQPKSSQLMFGLTYHF